MLLARFMSALVWAAVAASAVAWGLQSRGQKPVAAPVAGAGAPAAVGNLANLFGRADAAPVAVAAAPAQTQYRLLGVVAATSPRRGLASIEVDGNPRRTWKVGGAIDERMTLLAVRRDAVDLGPAGGPVELTLELAPASERPSPAAAVPVPRSGAGFVPTPGRLLPVLPPNAAASIPTAAPAPPPDAAEEDEKPS